MHYREALPKDVDGITSIHVVGSQQAYAGILPTSYLEGVMPQEKSDLWRSRLGEGVDVSRMSVTVAAEANDLAGFACFLFDQEQGFWDLSAQHLRRQALSAKRRG